MIKHCLQSVLHRFVTAGSLHIQQFRPAKKHTDTRAHTHAASKNGTLLENARKMQAVRRVSNQGEQGIARCQFAGSCPVTWRPKNQQVAPLNVHSRRCILLAACCGRPLQSLKLIGARAFCVQGKQRSRLVSLAGNMLGSASQEHYPTRWALGPHRFNLCADLQRTSIQVCGRAVL